MIIQMIRRGVLLFGLMTLTPFLGTANAQGYYQFLGPPRDVSDSFSPRYHIRYNTQGFDVPEVNWEKRARKLQKKGVPDYAIAEMERFPGGSDAIGEWIDQAFDEVQTQFMKCGSLASRAAHVSPSNLYVIIMPSAFFEPYYKIDVAGVYYPSTHQIQVLNIYYIWSGPNAGWLRHARDLLKWEMGNFFSTELGIQPEPRPDGWPCSVVR